MDKATLEKKCRELEKKNRALQKENERLKYSITRAGLYTSEVFSILSKALGKEMQELLNKIDID